MAGHGASVVVADLVENPREGGPPTHELVGDRHGVEAAHVECDVSSVADLEAAVEAAEAFGGVTATK